MLNKSVADLHTPDLMSLLEERSVESLTLEFKRDFPTRESAVKELSALGNTYGGHLVIGATADSKDGRLTELPGIDALPGARQKLTQFCYEHIYPPLDIHVSDPIPVPAHPNRVCYVVHVPLSTQAPHFIAGRKGAYVRTGEYNQPLSAKLATYEELRHLADRRHSAVQQRLSQLATARRRFDTLVRNEYAAHPRTQGDIGATIRVAVAPLFPVRALTDSAGLYQATVDHRIRWRTPSFPSTSDVLTQHESVVFIDASYRFSMMDVSAWGQVFNACEIENLLADDEKEGGHKGIHFYALLGYILVWVEYSRSFFAKLSYDGPLHVDVGLDRIQGVPLLLFPGNEAVLGPSSRLDDECSFSFVTSTNTLREARDSIVKQIAVPLLFAINAPDQALDPASVDRLVKYGEYYNMWRDKP